MKIINKVITFLGAAAVFPVLIIQTLFTVIVSIDKESIIFTAANLILGADNKLTGNRLGIEKSIADLFDYLTGKATSTFDFKDILQKLPAEFDPIKKLVVAAFAFAAAGAIVAVVIMGCALFTKAYKTIIGLSLGGAACFLTSIILFGQASKPLLDGTIDVATTLFPLLFDVSSFLGSIAVAALNGSINVDTCGLGGAIYGAMIVLFAVAVWEIAYYVTLPKEERTGKKVKA